jgi:hypothetical protein
MPVNFSNIGEKLKNAVGKAKGAVTSGGLKEGVGKLAAGAKEFGAGVGVMGPALALASTAGLMYGPQIVSLGGAGLRAADELMTRRRFTQKMNMVRDARQNQLLQEIEQQKLEQARALNEIRLSQMDPHLYAEISVGRQLPMGAVPIGGMQRRDLLDEVTTNMANGGYNSPGQQFANTPFGVEAMLNQHNPGDPF